jgi:hypothetical protein
MRTRIFSNGGNFPWITALSCAVLILSGCGGPAKTAPGPWGPSVYGNGIVLDAQASRSALDWGKNNARDAGERLGSHYTFSLGKGASVHRARVRTRWSRLALHAAERKLSAREPDPQTVERILKGPPLTITLTLKGPYKNLIVEMDMVLTQGSRRSYAPKLKRSPSRAVRDEGRVVAYEADLEGDFSTDGLNLKRSAYLEIRREDGTVLNLKIALKRLK